MFVQVKLNPYLCIVGGDNRNGFKIETSCRGWTPTCLIVFKSRDVLESTRSPSLSNSYRVKVQIIIDI